MVAYPTFGRRVKCIVAAMRFRLLPTKAQEAALSQHCAHARFVWNLALEQRNLYRPEKGQPPGCAAQCRQLTDAREGTWLGEGSAVIQQQALRDLDQAFRNWLSNPSHFGRPSWRKHNIDEGFRVVGHDWRWERLSQNRARVSIPKVGWVDWRWSKGPGAPKSYRVTRDAAGRWWIAFAVIPEPIPAPGNGSVVGVDRGVTVPFALSDGEMVGVPTLTLGERRRLRRLQRHLARQTKGSSRRQATKRKIARLRSREVNRRKDAVEKLTNRLARAHDVIRIEDLRIGNMTRSARGTIEKPGTNVRAKAGLNREILARGWGLFARRLEDKAPGRVERVNPANTSRRCAACSHVAKENRESQAVFVCVSCGHRDNADTNAAINIRGGTRRQCAGRLGVGRASEP